MKNKKILTFNLMIFCAICLFLPSIVIAQSSSYINDTSIDNRDFLTVTTSEGNLRVSTPYRSNISDTDAYDGTTYNPSHNAPRYIFNDSVRYNVFGEDLSSLLCRSVTNRSNQTIYLTGTNRGIRYDNKTEWQSFIDIIGKNTQPGIDIKKCFCTDTESRYRLQDGAYCGNDYCLNEDCVLDTQTTYPAPFDTANSACLPNTGYHMIGCTNELCRYEDTSQIVPGTSALSTSKKSKLDPATQISDNRKKGFCEICANFNLPRTGKDTQTSSFNRSFFGGNTHVPTAIWNNYIDALENFETADNNLSSINQSINIDVDQPLSQQIENYETILSLGTDIDNLNVKKNFLNTSLRNTYPDLVPTINLGIQYINQKIQYIRDWNTAYQNVLNAQNAMNQYNGRTDLSNAEIELIKLYKISNTQTQKSVPNKILKYNKTPKTITYKRKGATVTVTICFRYRPNNAYNQNNDCTKKGTCTD